MENFMESGSKKHTFFLVTLVLMSSLIISRLPIINAAVKGKEPYKSNIKLLKEFHKTLAMKQKGNGINELMKNNSTSYQD